MAIAADWPGLERNGKSEEAAVAKLLSYVSRYQNVAKRVLQAYLMSGAGQVRQPTGTGGISADHFRIRRERRLA